ncbi:DUF302 domain-containing protein [Bradyrhizobium erythrophlei]|uniref:DUF302 domain-containing protein n=1 Tax=Bradyrhizobium erythrophlei TaxID=1437360 RepID=A0A1M5K331_9BRAD|nr:DUF302 domain-containing protein [Bradyrhizobium erythrophlei]SHG47176.1 protein of unknown function DUF302 [Bradyrhizobium erythrophlei]
MATFFHIQRHGRNNRKVDKDPDRSILPRTVIIFGNPKAGTLPMTKSATLAIDLPMKALVWQDNQDRVRLTYNTSEYNAKYVLPRHGLYASDDASKALENYLTDAAERSTIN